MGDLGVTEQVRRAVSSPQGLDKLDLQQGRETGSPPPSKDSLLPERLNLCSGGLGEPASVFKQRNDVNKVVFKAHFSNRGLLNKQVTEKYREKAVSQLLSQVKKCT